MSDELRNSGSGSNPFKIGDIVRLKSGSPRLTVSYVATHTDGVTVCWIAYGTNVPHLITASWICFKPDYVIPQLR